MEQAFVAQNLLGGGVGVELPPLYLLHNSGKILIPLDQLQELRLDTVLYALQQLVLALHLTALRTLAGSAGVVRFLYLVVTSGSAGHIQSLIIGAVLVILGMQVAMGSFFGLSLAKNRQLVEDVIYMQRRQMFESSGPPAAVNTVADAEPANADPVRSER